MSYTGRKHGNKRSLSLIATREPHGHCTMKVLNNLVIVDATGPWNIEFLDILHKQLAENVEKVSHSNYGVLLSVHGEAVAGEDVVQAHIAGLRHGEASALAINLQHCKTCAISRAMLSRVYSACGLNFAFFHTEEEGMLWLTEQLA